MRLGTICSGIGVAELALDWCEPVFMAEIDRDANQVLDFHFPGVPNYGDITKADGFPAADILVAGTPCQSFSIQGTRRGMDDARGQLALRAVEIIRELRPRLVVWENVTGALHAEQGRAFASFVGALDELGYGYAWRVLDVQYLGSAQRRKRVFVVGHSGGWARAASVLFERPTTTKDSQPIIEEREKRSSMDAVRGAISVGMTGDETPKMSCELVPTLRASQGGEGVMVWGGSTTRKLTVVEWERLQGLPDGYTQVGHLTEARRKKLLGNAIAFPVMHWLSKRIREAWSD